MLHIGRCAPLLLGRPTLEKPEVSLDFHQHTMNLMDAVPMKVNSSGHLMIDLLEFPPAPPVTAKDCTVITKEKIRVTNNGNKFKITLKKKECRAPLGSDTNDKAEVPRRGATQRRLLSLPELKGSAMVQPHAQSIESHWNKSTWDFVARIPRKL